MLVGAGKMGGAMLEGWLRVRPRSDKGRGARAAAVAANRGARARAACGSIPTATRLTACRGHRHRGEAAGRRARCCRRLQPLVGAVDRRGLDHGRPHARIPASALRRQCRRRCAPCRTRRPRSAAASRSRCRMRTRPAQRELAHRLLAATGSRRMDRRRSAAWTR